MQAPPILPVDWRVQEYLRKLSEDMSSFHSRLRMMETHPAITAPEVQPVQQIVVQQQVVGLGQLSQGQFTYAPIVLVLPPTGDPLAQNGQIVFLQSAGILTQYVFDGTTDPGVWRAISSSMGGTNPCVLAYNSIDQSITSGTETSLGYDSEVYDNDGIHSTTTNTGRLTAQHAGKYSVALNVNFEANATANRAAVIYKNGSTLIGSASTRAVNDGISRTYLSVVAHCQLAVGDRITSAVYQDTGIALNVQAVGLEPNLGMTLISS